MRENYEGGKPMMIEMTPYLRNLLDQSLTMRRNVMDEDIRLVKNALWNTEMTRRNLLKEIARMITQGDYQAAKRWVEDNLMGHSWYNEYKQTKGGRGRKGILAFIGYQATEKKQEWGGE
jgi:hypothetical protein